MINDEEYELFLNRTLNLIENAVNFLKNDKHIVAYNKMIGVHQKICSIVEEEKKELLLNELICKDIIHHLLDGRYEQAKESIMIVKTNLYKIYGKVKKKNETNRNKIF